MCADSAARWQAKTTDKQMRIDVDEVKHAARGNWARIVCDVGGIPDDSLNPHQHGPCPKCGGTKPFRVFNDFAETGGAVCSRCGKFADGIAVVEWSLGVKFEEALERVAAYLGIQPSNKPKRSIAKISRPKTPRKPIEAKAEDIVRVEWSAMQVRLWCMRKPPLTAEALKTAGAYCARYKDKFNVIAIPCGKNWTLYNLSGGKLPGGENEYVKVKNVNKFPGWMRVNAND